MLVKTQVSLTLALIAFTVATMAGMSWYQQRESERLVEGQAWVSELVRAVQDLSLLSNELLLTPGDRVLKQWGHRDRTFNELLESSHCHQLAVCHDILVDVQAEHAALDQAFGRLAERTLSGVSLQDAHGPLRTRQAMALQIRIQRIASLLQTLSDTKRLVRLAHLERMTRLVMVLDIGAFLLGGVLLWLLRRRIMMAIDGLADGFQRVASGDLRHRVDVGQTDEFGELARGFDRMTAQVAEKSDQLSASEAALAAVNRELEQKVATRTAELDLAVRQLYEAGEEVAQSQRLAMMGKMVASISHELNNPLMGALNYVQYVRPRLVDQRLDTWLGKAERDITRAADVVHNLLAFGKKGDEKRRPVALASVVAEVIEFAGPALRRADAEVKNRVAADLPLVSAQPKLLRQVLLNLLINAADAVADSPQRTVEIAAQGHGDQVDLSVEDTGPGVPEALRERIFEPFFSTKSQERGSGLGLAIARRLIEGSGGTLAYCPGARGARFVVGLRVVSDDDTDLAAPEIVAAKIRPASSAS